MVVTPRSGGLSETTGFSRLVTVGLAGTEDLPGPFDLAIAELCQAIEINPDQELGGHSPIYLPVVRTLNSLPVPVPRPPSAENKMHRGVVHLDELQPSHD